MAAPFKCDEKVTVEALTGVQDPVYGTETKTWTPVAVNYWANVQDVLPVRGEETANNLVQAVQRTRLRMRRNSALSMAMRVTLHGRGDRVMQIIAGPALLNDRLHEEWLLEGYSTHG